MHFTDSAGTKWTVYECPPNRITFGDRLIEDSPAHLTFETRTGERTYLRRLRQYPATWQDLSTAALEDLLRRAHAVGGSRRGEESEETRRSVDQLTT